MKTAVIVALVLAVATCAAPVWSQGPPDGGGQRGPGKTEASCPSMAVTPPPAAMISRIADKLELEDDVTAKLKDVLTKGDEAMSPLSQALTKATKALRTALLASEYDAQKVKDLAAAAGKAEAAVVGASIDEWTQIRSILTAGQVTKLQEAMTPQKRSTSSTDQRPDGPPPGGPGGPGGPPPGQNW